MSQFLFGSFPCSDTFPDRYIPKHDTAEYAQVNILAMKFFDFEPPLLSEPPLLLMRGRPPLCCLLPLWAPIPAAAEAAVAAWALPDAPAGLTPLTPAVPTRLLPLVRDTEACSFVGDGSAEEDSIDGRRAPSIEEEAGDAITWCCGLETEWGDAEEPPAGGGERTVATDERRWAEVNDPICKGHDIGPPGQQYKIAQTSKRAHACNRLFVIGHPPIRVNDPSWL